MRQSLVERLHARLMRRRQADALRQHRSNTAISAREITYNGRRLLNFSSNDYLGLSHHPDVLNAARNAIDEGVGAGASHLITGHHYHHQALQEALADWQQREAAVLFSTGYMANLGVVQALCARHDQLLQDKLNHASLVDAAQLCGARLRRYRHASARHAAELLAQHEEKATLVATDGVFSMDGDLAPLGELSALCRDHRATLMVDDAHGMGVLGTEGRGAATELDQNECPILMGTLGKAFGTFGAFVCGSQALIDGLTQFARSHVYTTATPPAWASASLAALTLIRRDDSLRQQLQANIQHFRAGLHQHPRLSLMASETAIQPVLIGDNTTTVRLSEALETAGYRVAPIRPPTVPEGQARLRVTLSAAHTPADIDGLVAALDRAVSGLA